MKTLFAAIKPLTLTGAFALLMLTACNWDKPGKAHAAITRDTLKYQYRQYSKDAPDCGKRKDSTCTNVKFKYPEFEQPELNGEVSSRIVNLFRMNDEVKSESIEELAQQFIDMYTADTVGYKSAYLLHINSRVVRQDSALCSLQLTGEQYTGGAHGANIISFFNWNTKTKQIIELKDILKDNYQDKLNTTAERLFRKQENLTDTASLKDYFFKDNKFALNENFLITPVGLRFLFNQYEIKPYAAGQTDLFIPYAFIKELLRPNTVIAQYHP